MHLRFAYMHVHPSRLPQYLCNTSAYSHCHGCCVPMALRVRNDVCSIRCLPKCPFTGGTQGNTLFAFSSHYTRDAGGALQGVLFRSRPCTVGTGKTGKCSFGRSPMSYVSSFVGLCPHCVHRGRWHSSHRHLIASLFLRVSTEESPQGKLLLHFMQVCGLPPWPGRALGSQNKHTALSSSL